MSSSIGRLALGVVGALIGAPFGLAAVGFAIGSTIGGFIFAPEGPSVEGPRLGDTDVTASSLGKVIPFHYGVTRSAGNVFWSAGLKEVTTEEDAGGGKGGGGGGTATSYSYFASFACAFGRGPAENVLRMWADGKLIYDVTGGSSDTTGGSTSAPSFNFRFKNGGEGTSVDPLIAESINRRLAGLPDVNEGNGPQSDYRTMAELIAETSSSSDPRSAIYATYLNDLRVEAEAAGGAPPDYKFTPSYKELCYIVFDDMPLEDFGNRIPNITAEIVWTTDTNIDPNDTVSETPVTQISTFTDVPDSGMGVDAVSQTLLVKSGNQLRRFSASSLRETLDRSATQTATARVFTGNDDRDNSAPPISITTTVTDILGADNNGNYIVRGTRTGDATTPIVAKVANTSLEIIGTVASTVSFGQGITETPAGARDVTFGTNAGSNGARALFAASNAAGNFYLFETQSDVISTVWGTGANTFAGLGDGPMVSGGGGAGESTVYWISANASSWGLYKVDMRFDSGTGTPLVNFTTLDSGAVGTEDPRTVLYNLATDTVTVLFNTASGGRIKQYDPEAEGTSDDPYEQYSNDLSLSPPSRKSGLQRSSATGSVLVYLSGSDAAVLDTSNGSEVIYTNVLSTSASPDTQLYLASNASIFSWVGGAPVRVAFDNLSTNLYSTDLSTVITDICKRTGMEPDEYNVSDIAGKFNVRGYTIGRSSNGRKALENLLLAYFVDGIETDWEVTFRERTTTPVRTITEDELGSVRAPTGDVFLLEARQPEYDLPSEIAMVYTDPDRDYQQGSAHMRRTSNPSPVMYSNKTQNLEMPLVLRENEARDITQRLLYLTWMSRDTTKSRLPWTHADLDPTDVVRLELNDGRVLTDRIAKATMGANFEIEMETARSGDPVYTPQVNAEIGSSNIPTTSILTPAFSKMFVFDIPLLYDYHDTNRTSTRYYTAVGSDTPLFLSADLYVSPDNSTFLSFDTAVTDVTWGQIADEPLGEPRSLWTTDTENTLRVILSVDNGDVNSTTREQILNDNANLALIWDQASGVGEIIQFQNVTDNGDGSITLDTLTRGRRGTDYATASHRPGEFFILLTESAVLPQQAQLSVVGSTQYFKAVSRGGLVGGSPANSTTFQARDLKPYAPSRVERSDDGTDLTIRWVRRSRVGGEWNMFGTGVEELALNEDSEAYEFFLLPNNPSALTDFDANDASTYLTRITTTSPEVTLDGGDLSTFGYALSDIVKVAIFQVSAQVGRGFPRLVGLAA